MTETQGGNVESNAGDDATLATMKTMTLTTIKQVEIEERHATTKVTPTEDQASKTENQIIDDMTTI